jgi:hypothetical protein
MGELWGQKVDLGRGASGLPEEQLQNGHDAAHQGHGEPGYPAVWEPVLCRAQTGAARQAGRLCWS